MEISPFLMKEKRGSYETKEERKKKKEERRRSLSVSYFFPFSLFFFL